MKTPTYLLTEACDHTPSQPNQFTIRLNVGDDKTQLVMLYSMQTSS